MSKFYITTSIAYANAAPHVGHALEAVQADALARFHRTQGESVFFLTGTDEHGDKLQKVAADKDITPKELVDTNSALFMQLYADLGISFDRFIRTTEADHKKSSQKLWEACQKDIYKGSYTGLYCVGEEAYITEKDLVDGKCPNHGTVPEKLTIDSYFFALSKYQDQIEELIATDQLRVYPQSRKNEILQFIRGGLEDISISRPKERLKWGIDVPGDDTHVMYVWFDALANYITGVGYHSEPKAFEAWWPADLQCIGKDILRFHAVLWPAMLLSAGLPTAKALNVHGFITSEGKKMSKSLGNVVDPVDMINRYGAEALRYYLLREIASGGDGDFSQHRFETLYTTELANDLGNLVQRSLSMIVKYRDGNLIDIPATLHDAGPYRDAFQDFRFDKALEDVWALVRGVNQLIDTEKPWKLATTDPKQLDWVLGQIVADLRQIASLIEPFLPATSIKIKQALGGDKVDMSIGILFPRLETPEDKATK